MRIYITEGIGQPAKEKAGRTVNRRPLTKAKWLQFYNADSLYSTPEGTRLSFILNENDFGYELASKDKLRVTVTCDLKLNELNNLKVNLEGITREHDLIFEDIWSACWLGLFQQFNFNPLMSLIKPQARSWEKEPFEYMSKTSVKPTTLILDTEKEMGFKATEINAVLLAERYLKFVDFFNGNDPMKWLAVEGIFTDWKHYNLFEKNVINEKTRKQAHYELAKKRERTIKTYLGRARELEVLSKVGTGNRGGKLTKKGEKILVNYVLYTNQNKKVLDSVKYEVRK